MNPATFAESIIYAANKLRALSVDLWDDAAYAELRRLDSETGSLLEMLEERAEEDREEQERLDHAARPGEW